jgi:hypothetical protein
LDINDFAHNFNSRFRTKTEAGMIETARGESRKGYSQNGWGGLPELVSRQSSRDGTGALMGPPGTTAGDEASLRERTAGAASNGSKMIF